MPTIILLRGAPGSGKSTLARSLKGYKHIEADMYFMIEGEYKFCKDRLKYAHEWCQNQTELAMQARQNIVVSNTFTKHWEMQPYLDMAQLHSYGVTIKHCTGDFENVHGVPAEVVERMKRNYEK